MRISRMIRKRAITGGVVLAAACAVAVPATAAHASVREASSAAQPNYFACSEGGYKGVCAALSHATLLTYRSGGSTTLPAGAEVNVQCWYLGGSDGYYDHVVWTSPTGKVQGHVQDEWVNFGGKKPPQVGLPECG